MSHKITIDRGNTALKAALWDGQGVLVATLTGDYSRPAGDLAATLAATYLHEGDSVDAVAWCTVVASEHADDEASLAAAAPLVRELTAMTSGKISIGYLTPESLGADRVAAVLGALTVAGDDRPLLVADIGTAVTCDYVSPQRRYAGGNIAPGIEMRLRALATFTDALPAVKVEGGDIPLWGRTTAEAMRSGAVRGIAAELEYYHRAAGHKAVAVITGGSAKLLVDENILTFDYIYDPYLVHRGLYSFIKDEN